MDIAAVFASQTRYDAVEAIPGRGTLLRTPRTRRPGKSTRREGAAGWKRRRGSH
jgi:hypothetical protein